MGLITLNISEFNAVSPIVMLAGTTYAASGKRTVKTTNLSSWVYDNVGHDTNMIRAIAYNSGRWVLGGYLPDSDWNDQDSIQYSDDNGETWIGLGATVRGLIYQCNGLVYANNQFIGVGNGGTDRIATSPDGITWTGRGQGSFDGRGVAYGNSIYTAVGQVAVDGAAYTSPDGITWTLVDNITDYLLSAVAYGNGVWIAVGNDSSTSNIARSDNDWSTWNLLGNGLFTDALAVATDGSGLWVVGGTGTNALAYSDDNGLTWNGIGVTEFTTVNYLIYYDGYFYAAGSGGTYHGISRSSDGINWTKVIDDATPETFTVIGSI